MKIIEVKKSDEGMKVKATVAGRGIHLLYPSDGTMNNTVELSIGWIVSKNKDTQIGINETIQNLKHIIRDLEDMKVKLAGVESTFAIYEEQGSVPCTDEPDGLQYPVSSTPGVLYRGDGEEVKECAIHKNNPFKDSSEWER